ncbi:hypothetical protein chiPu_0015421 [Chiloscyllium punctatum]|uniref:Uncharacterized protein n=1 Tax=Chiloscyllium punctatum TaxID=137246 RepID=A0A401T2P7_CHIPU|nr:hypothetical protein [Chiloscyllium punctatum]
MHQSNQSLGTQGHLFSINGTQSLVVQDHTGKQPSRDDESYNRARSVGKICTNLDVLIDEEKTISSGVDKGDGDVQGNRQD